LVRRGESKTIARLASRLSLPPDNRMPSDPHVKAHVLLQCHFGRLGPLPLELQMDMQRVTQIALSMCHAAVDVASSFGWLTPALAALDVCQMIVRACWDRPSVFSQLPFATLDMIETLKSSSIDSLYELSDALSTNTSNTVISSLVSNHGQLVRSWQDWLRRYPNLDVTYELSDNVSLEEEGVYRASYGDTFTLHVHLTRRLVYDELSKKEPGVCVDPVSAKITFAPLDCSPFYSKPKEEGWWILFAHWSSKTLLAIKKVPFSAWTTGKPHVVESVVDAAMAHVSLEVTLPVLVDAAATPGDLFKMYLITDAWIGADQEFEINMRLSE
jgi:pre-mRNA-splicing helicase BRR2